MNFILHDYEKFAQLHVKLENDNVTLPNIQV